MAYLVTRWIWPVALLAGLVLPPAMAQTPPGATPTPQSLNDWLDRLHDASRRRAYTGTFVVSAGTAMATSKIWHVCDGKQQVERIETLTGAPRTTLRRNDDVITFVPQSKSAWVEKREALRPFPDRLKTPANAIEEHYNARLAGLERVAGVDADVVVFEPQDKLRFGYKVWSEKTTGLAVKLQTLDARGQVLEQMVFSELQLDAPVQMDKLLKQMNNTQGYQVHKAPLNKTTAEAEGWQLKTEVPGFVPMSCHTHGEPGAKPGTLPLQWVFSDGLASVSLFLERYDPQRHGRERMAAMGATHTLTQRIGDHWLTAMGEVPVSTLKLFAQSLERQR